jgi:hypothetical protein
VTLRCWKPVLEKITARIEAETQEPATLPQLETAAD